jgi:hypothetical protein
MDVKLGLSQIVGFENMVLRRMTGTERYEVTGGWRNCIMRGSIICTVHHTVSG